MGIRAVPAGDKVATVEVTQENFNQVVSGNNMVIVDFWAPWCGPCRSFAPAYEAASEKHPDVVFAKVNTEEQQALAGYFQIRSIPTLMVFRDKIIIFAQPGALPAAALDQVIEKAKALDMDEVRREIAAEKDQQAPAG
jgi:thioredoxin